MKHTSSYVSLNTDSVYFLYHSTSYLVKKADDRQLLSEANVLGARYEPTFVPWQFYTARMPLRWYFLRVSGKFSIASAFVWIQPLVPNASHRIIHNIMDIMVCGAP